MGIVEKSEMREGECPVRDCGGRLDYDGGIVLGDGGGYYQAKCAACGAEMKEWFKLEFDEHEVEVTYEPPSSHNKLANLAVAANAAEGALEAAEKPNERRATMAGEYRTEAVLKQLPADIAGLIRTGGLRIALTSQSMRGVDRRPDLSERLAAAYGAMAETAKYATGLRNGSMVPVVEALGGNRNWAPGELFMRS